LTVGLFPVTVIVYVPAGVRGGGGGGPPPPHPAKDRAKANPTKLTTSQSDFRPPLRRRVPIPTTPRSGSKIAYKGRGGNNNKGEADASPLEVVIVIITVAPLCPETELGLNVQAAPAGNPLQLKLVALGSGASTKNMKFTGLPACTAMVPVTTKMEIAGLTWVVSLDVSFEVKISPPPETVTVLVTELALFATLTVSVTAG